MKNATSRILVIEDNRDVWDALSALFTDDSGFVLTFVGDGEQGSNLLHQGTFDLAIVDLELPHKSGRQIIQDARRFGIGIPILVLSSNQETVSITDNLDGGANDYVTKPFDGAILLSRVKRLIRDSLSTAESIVRFRDFAFDTFRDQVILAGKAGFRLPNNAARILEVMLRNKSAVVVSDALIREVWGAEGRVSDKTLNRNVNRLNETFEANHLHRIVNCISGKGYELIRG